MESKQIEFLANANEMKIGDGIYFTDYRNKTNSHYDTKPTKSV